jgi:DNA primase
MKRTARRDDAEFRRAVEDIRARHAISDVASKFTNLKPTQREMVGLCPFHTERTRSG